MWRRAPNSDPFAQGDQDAFNALLASEIPDQAVHLLADEERPIAKGSEVKVVDSHTLSCTYNGQGVRLLHADGSHKPWISGSLLHVRSQPYVRLLRRLLLETDVPLRVPSEELPIWLREGRVAEATLWTLDGFNAVLHPILRREKIRRLLKRVLRPAVAQQAVGVMRNRNGMLNG